MKAFIKPSYNNNNTTTCAWKKKEKVNKLGEI